MAENKPAERLPGPLPIFSQRLESDVLREKKPTECGAAGEQGGIREFSGIIFPRGNHVHPQTPELIGDSCGHMDIEVERCHAALFRRAAMRCWRSGEAGCAARLSISASSAVSSASISAL